MSISKEKIIGSIAGNIASHSGMDRDLKFAEEIYELAHAVTEQPVCGHLLMEKYRVTLML